MEKTKPGKGKRKYKGERENSNLDKMVREDLNYKVIFEQR